MNDITNKLIAFFKPVHIRIACGYWLFLCLIGLSIPEDILINNPWAVEFSNTMASIVPQIDKITQLGLRPDSNRFYYSVLWALSPVTVGLTIYSVLKQKEKYFYKTFVKYQNRPFRIIFLHLFMIMCVYYGLNLLGATPKGMHEKIAFSSIIGRSTYGQIVLYEAPILFMIGSPIFLFHYFKYFIKFKQEKKNG